MKLPYIAIEDKQENIAKLIPNVSEEAEYKPVGWEFAEDLFVDNSGFGQPGDAALTGTQFIAKVKKGFAYAITDVGQFQVYVSVFKKED